MAIVSILVFFQKKKKRNGICFLGWIKDFFRTIHGKAAVIVNSPDNLGGYILPGENPILVTPRHISNDRSLRETTRTG